MAYKNLNSEAKNKSLDEVVKETEKRLGYELDPIHLINIASHLLKMHLIGGGYIGRRESND